MPEGHTVHRHARIQHKLLASHEVTVTSPQGRFTGAEALSGRVLESVTAYGKHLLYTFAGPEPHHVHVHLGLFGKFRRHKQPAPAPRDTCRMRLASEEHALDLVGPTICRLIDAGERDALLARIGPDLLDGQVSIPEIVQRLQRKRAPIGAALMDQSVLSGVGNIYRAEALYACKLHPETRCGLLTAATLTTLVTTLVTMLAKGVKDGRIVTVERQEGEPRRRSRRESLLIYGHRRCRACASPVSRYLLRARWVYVCEACQPLGSGSPSNLPAAEAPERNAPSTRPPSAKSPPATRRAASSK